MTTSDEATNAQHAADVAAEAAQSGVAVEEKPVSPVATLVGELVKNIFKRR